MQYLLFERSVAFGIDFSLLEAHDLVKYYAAFFVMDTRLDHQHQDRSLKEGTRALPVQKPELARAIDWDEFAAAWDSISTSTQTRAFLAMLPRKIGIFGVLSRPSRSLVSRKKLVSL